MLKAIRLTNRPSGEISNSWILVARPKPVEESKDERRKLRVGLNAKPALECPEVIKRFIDHGQPDNGVNKVSTDADIKEGADEQRR